MDSQHGNKDYFGKRTRSDESLPTGKEESNSFKASKKDDTSKNIKSKEPDKKSSSQGSHNSSSKAPSAKTKSSR